MCSPPYTGGGRGGQTGMQGTQFSALSRAKAQSGEGTGQLLPRNSTVGSSALVVRARLVAFFGGEEGGGGDGGITATNLNDADKSERGRASLMLRPRDGESREGHTIIVGKRSRSLERAATVGRSLTVVGTSQHFVTPP